MGSDMSAGSIGAEEQGKAGEFGLEIFWKILERLLKEESPLHLAWRKEAEALRRELWPRDAVERLMVDQILWLHARFAQLSVMSARQTELEGARAIHGACDRLADTLRRHMAALVSYRYPKRKKFLAVKQANFANQQIVVTGRRGRGRPRKNVLQTTKGDERGGAFERAISETQKAEVPALENGVAQEAARHFEASAVGEIYGAADSNGEEKV
jgi:hypothetical protein